MKKIFAVLFISMMMAGSVYAGSNDWQAQQNIELDGNFNSSEC